jgi:hypothetical protein
MGGFIGSLIGEVPEGLKWFALGYWDRTGTFR